jgi:hypothetical protein
VREKERERESEKEREREKERGKMYRKVLHLTSVRPDALVEKLRRETIFHPDSFSIHFNGFNVHKSCKKYSLAISHLKSMFKL